MGASTLAMGLVGGLGSLVVFRLMLGVGESITFPGARRSSLAMSRRKIADRQYAVAAGIALGPVVGTFAGGLMVAS